MCKRVLLLMLLICFGLVAKNFKLKVKVQPLLSVSEEGNLTSSGKFKYGFNRLKLYGSYKEAFSSGRNIEGKVSLDFSEDSIENIVKNAFIESQLHPYLGIKLGQYKVPFALSDYGSTDMLGHIYRSESSRHLRTHLQVAGYKPGITVTGTFWNDKIHCGLSLFWEESLPTKGFDPLDLVSLPSLQISVNPLEFLSFHYGLIVPGFATLDIDSKRTRTTLPLQTLALQVSLPKIYRTDLELFFGVDTAKGKELMMFQESYDDNCSFSLYSNHVFTFQTNDNSHISLAVAGEFLNGLTFYDGIYNSRSFTYNLQGTLGYFFKKNVGLQLGFKEQFDDAFKATKQKRISLQCTYVPILIKRSKR